MDSAGRNFQHSPEQGVKVANTAEIVCSGTHKCTKTVLHTQCVCTDGPMGGRVVLLLTIKLLLGSLVSLVHTLSFQLDLFLTK